MIGKGEKPFKRNAYSEAGEQTGGVESSEALLSAFTTQLAEVSGGLR